jgi:hypothetical protein
LRTGRSLPADAAAKISALFTEAAGNCLNKSSNATLNEGTSATTTV